MSKQRHATDYKHIQGSSEEREEPRNNFLLSKHLKKVYPIEIQKACSLLSLSSLSLSLSQTSNDSSLITPPYQKYFSSSFSLIPQPQGREVPARKTVVSLAQNPISLFPREKELMRCSWITNSSVRGKIKLVKKVGLNWTRLIEFRYADKVYVQFHDECWGVPVYDDHRLFELLALAGLLMDFNWTEILKRRESIREAFAGFNAMQVAKMGEREIKELVSNASLMLAESRVRCIVDNAKCIVKIAREFGSFSCYMWNHMNYKPIINRFRYARNVPLRTPKAEVISKDLVKRGFRLVGPVIVNSFMQAAGMTIDHLVYCFRHKECVNLAERPWRHV